MCDNNAHYGFFVVNMPQIVSRTKVKRGECVGSAVQPIQPSSALHTCDLRSRRKVLVLVFGCLDHLHKLPVGVTHSRHALKRMLLSLSQAA